MTLRKIVSATDLSDGASCALQFAWLLAQKTGADLDVLYVDTNVIHEVDRRIVEDAVKSCLQPELPDGDPPAYSLVIRTDDDVVEAIQDYAAAQDADLIAMGTHGRKGLRHFFLGSVAETIIHRFSGPVLTARGVASMSDTVERILVPIDFSVHSGGALRHAKELARLFDAELILLFVAEERIVPFFSDTGIPAFTQMRMPAEMMQNAKRALVQLFENTEGPVGPVRYEVAEGKPVAKIIESAAEHHADLIVLATSGTSENRHWPMGSVAEGVLRSAVCPVLAASTFASTPARNINADGRSEPFPV